MEDVIIDDRRQASAQAVNREKKLPEAARVAADFGSIWSICSSKV